MKFGKKLLAQQDIPLFRNQWVSYTNLKKLIKEIVIAEKRTLSTTEILASELWWFDSTQKTSVGNFAPERIAFVRAVEDEIDKTQHHYAASIKSIRHMISDIYSRLNSRFRLDGIMQDIDAIASEILLLDRFIWHGKQLILKITKKHDRSTNYQVNSWILIRMERTEFWNAKLDELLIGVSDAYTAARQLQKNADGETFVESRQLGDAENFVRKNEKYFVKPEDVMLVKLLITKHVPLDIFGRKKPKGNMKLENLAGLTDASVINSIYLDDDTRSMYHHRTGVEGKKGNLIRVRWYGPTANPAAECWMERKTRREPDEDDEYVVDEAIKERFRINRRNVRNYMLGDWSMEKKAKSMVQKKQIKEKDVKPMLKTANNIQAEIVTKHLHSALRTVVRRSAFQEGADQSLRFSLDHNLHIIDEVVDASEEDWARDLDQPLKLSSVMTLPYAVLEVKTQKNAPEWVAQLKESGYLIPAAHFSKFLYGTCKLSPAEVRFYPSWWEHVIQLESAVPPSPPLITCAFMTKTPASVKFRSGLVERMQLNSDLTATLKSTAELMNASVELHNNTAQNAQTLQQRKDSRRALELEKGVDVIPLSQSGSKVAFRETAVPPPKKEGPVQRVAVKQASPAKDGATVIEMKPLEKRNSFLFKLGKKEDKVSNKQRTMEQRAAKTFFANERTMLSWLNASTFLALAGITLLGTQTETGRNSGIALIAITIVFALYALYKYLTRLFGLKDSKKAGLADKWGPPFLIACFVGVLIFLAIYYGRRATDALTVAEQNQVTF